MRGQGQGGSSDHLLPNPQGGSVQVYSAFTLDPNATTTVYFRGASFVKPGADYLGAAIYSAQVRLGCCVRRIWRL